MDLTKFDTAVLERVLADPVQTKDPVVRQHNEELIAKIREELDRRGKEQKAKAIKPRHQFRMCFYSEHPRGVFDSSVVCYTLFGELLNEAEYRALSVLPPLLFTSGSMQYLYNTATHRIICAIGGGTNYIHGDGRLRGEKPCEEAVRVVAELSAFLKAFPCGGDVTSIVTSQQYFK